MVRKLVLAFGSLGVASVIALSLLTIPLLRRLPKPSRVSMDGFTTIDHAVAAYRRTKLQGSSPVAYAPQASVGQLDSVRDHAKLQGKRGGRRTSMRVL